MGVEINDQQNENWLLKCENQQLKTIVVELENIIEGLTLQMQTIKKHNERGAGRKQYSDKDVIRRIFYLYARGKNYQQIADKLNCEKVPTKAGGTWAKSSVRFILYNESYIEKGVLSEKEYNLDFPYSLNSE